MLATIPRLPPEPASEAEMGSARLEVVKLDPDGGNRRAFDTEAVWAPRR